MIDVLNVVYNDRPLEREVPEVVSMVLAAAT